MLLSKRVIKWIDTSSAKYLNIWREQKTEEYLGNYFPLIVSAILRKWREHMLKKKRQQQQSREDREQTDSDNSWRVEVNGTETCQWHQIKGFAQLKTTNFKGILSPGQYRKFNPQLIHLEGQVRGTHSEKTERLRGTEKWSICLGPKRAVKAEGQAVMRDQSRAQPKCPGKWLVQSYNGQNRLTSSTRTMEIH